MKDIQNQEWIDSLSNELENALILLNSYVLMKICERIGDISKTKNLKTAAEYAVFDMKNIKKEIEKTKKWSKKEIDSIFDKLAKANVDFANDFYTYRGLPKIDEYKKNSALSIIVDKVKDEQKKIFENISKTTAIGMTDRNGNFVPLRKQYINIINTAVNNVKANEQDFYSQMRPIVNQLVKSGLRTVDFESGYQRRIDSQVRMNILDGMRELNHRMQEQVGKEFDFDGWEVSVHALCATDHQDVQGRQYTKDEYERLNKSLKRPIGEMNCRHFALPIILGVSKPVYTKDEIKKANERSNEIVKYKKGTEEKQTTRYEASQIQRKYERKIRDARTALEAAKSTEDKIMIDKKNRILRILIAEYKKFSSDVGLKVRMERTR